MNFLLIFFMLAEYAKGQEIVLRPMETYRKNVEYPGVIFEENYSKHGLPISLNKRPVEVNFSMNINGILAIDEPKQAISLESTIRMYWYDKRISLNMSNTDVTFRSDSKGQYLLFNRDPSKDIWFPDVFIDKAKDLRVPVYQIPPAYLRIYQTGLMVYSARVNYDLSCPMNFRDYPVDEQECDIKFETWGHPTDLMVFHWNLDDVKINKDITLNQHYFQAAFHKGDENNFSTGSFSSVTVTLYLTRKLSYHLLRTYLPSILFVMVAWFSMFVPLNHVPGRVTMNMTTLLTLSSMFNSLTTVTPPISYTTRLDTWMVFCIIFVFLTLFEFTIVIFLKYYLRHLPAFKFKLMSNGNSAEKREQRRQPSIFEIKSQLQAWMRNEREAKETFARNIRVQPNNRRRIVNESHRTGGPNNFSIHQGQAANNRLHQDTDDDASSSEDEAIMSQQRLESHEKIIKTIEKWSVIVYFLTFVIFCVIYWWGLFEVYPGWVEDAKVIARKSAKLQ